MVARGPETVVRGFSFQDGRIDISRSRSVTVGDCVFRGGTTAISLDGASGALIVNNEFRGVSDGVISGWALDRSTISGTNFFHCGKCSNPAFTEKRTPGTSGKASCR